MSSQFYSRYVPPTKASSSEPKTTDQEQEKRKRKRKPSEPDYRDERIPEDLAIGSKKPDGDTSSGTKQKKREKKKNKVVEEESREDGVMEGLAASKHSGVRSRFEKSERKSQLIKREKDHQDVFMQAENESKDATPEIHGLEPIPQPEIEEEIMPTPFATQPEWMRNPIKTSASASCSFQELPLHDTTKRALSSRGFEQAFAIQSAVLPLLLPGPRHHDGDVCIASSTGSGKTLGFILPMIEALRDKPQRRLRGLIVVPTRELVSQTRSIFETCASGSGLRVASSEGSKTLAEERHLLIEQFSRYSIKETEKQSRVSVDYLTIGDSDEDKPDDDRDITLHTPSSRFNEFVSKIDVLICTPGRLVDHLKGTKGFNIQNVQWFVVDEVDKLLGQSFQEWIDHVIPALERNETSDSILNQIRGPPITTKRKVRKIIASATLATDIGKLVDLRLHRPKLVTLEGNLHSSDQGTRIAQQTQEFVLPTNLSEAAITIKDTGIKPLCLLHLLDPLMIDGADEGQHLVDDEPSSQDTTSDASSEATSDDDSSSASEPESQDDSMDTYSVASDRSESLSSSEDASSVQSIEGEPTRLAKGGKADTKHVKASIRGSIVFTSTNENAQRLTRLLKYLRPRQASRIGCLVGSSRSASRRKTLSKFRNGTLSVIVASDLAARGLNVGNTAQVVNYDVPRSLESYVHRVGRTARAGNNGKATTLIAYEQARWFWNEIARSSRVYRRNKVSRAQPAPVSDEDYKVYERALQRLSKEAKRTRDMMSTHTY